MRLVIIRLDSLLVAIGIVLLGAAWWSARSIPDKATQDHIAHVRHVGSEVTRVGTLNITYGYEEYGRISANRRMAQNVWLGGAGLICLTIGLVGVGRRRTELVRFRIDTERTHPVAPQKATATTSASAPEFPGVDKDDPFYTSP
jgi:hypothetical protein